MRYTVSAYLCTNNPIKIDSLKTDFWFEVEDFIWDNVENQAEGKKKIRNRNYNSKSGIFLNCEDATFINHIHCFVRCLHWIIKNPTQSVNTDCVGFLHTILALLLGEGKDGVEDAEVEAAVYGNPTAVGTLRVK